MRRINPLISTGRSIGLWLCILIVMTFGGEAAFAQGSSGSTLQASKTLETKLGPFGHALSGGECQRPALARALLRRAPVLVLDESTSATDLAAEAALINSLLQNRTASILIIISHRLKSVANLRRIIVLGAGKVVATGAHESLYQDCPLYQALWASHGELMVN